MYHFIGIKGSGMSALAQILKELGYYVQGSDLEKHFFTEDKLRELDIKILPFDKDNIKEGMKIIVGAAFNAENNEEVKRAEEMDAPMFTYSEMVGSLTKKYKSICIAGCHGKTTTSAMMSQVFDKIVGANYLIGDGSGHANKANELFILESCEYKRHFLEYNPYYAIITNIDLDHVDYYKDIDDVIQAYTDYANKAEKLVLVCGDDNLTRYLDLNKPIFYYGIDADNDIKAINVVYSKSGISFEVEAEGNFYGNYDLPIYGKHMLLDTLAVIATAYYERLEYKDVIKALKDFKNACRRFSEKEVLDNIIIDDYAHHPNEIKATIKACKQKYPDKKLVAVFGPHTFSRTKEFKDDYVKVLSEADKTYVLDIFKSREDQSDYPGITSDIIISGLENAEALKLSEGNKLKDIRNSVIMFMSPNDIDGLENDVIEAMNEEN